MPYTAGKSKTGIAAFTDANLALSAANFTASIAWGDGTSSSGTVTAAGAGAYSVAASHQYASAGSWLGGLTIRQTDGWTGWGSYAVTAGNAPISVSAASGTFSAGVSQSGTLTTFTDGNTTLTAADFSANITWGDGTSSWGTVTAQGGGAYAVAGPHRYASVGTDLGHATVYDDHGGTAAASYTATVNNAPITINAGSGAYTSGVSQSGTVATFTDGNTALSASDFTASISWGDGTTSAATVTAQGGVTYGVFGGHLYSAAGSWPGSVLVRDTRGTTASANYLATVSAVVRGLSAAAPSSSEIDLAWTAAAPDLTGYNIYRSTSATGGLSLLTSLALPASVTAYQDSGLIEGTHYFYQVKAVQSSNPAGYTAIDAYTPPAAPTVSATALSSQQVRVSWVNHSLGAMGFVVQRSSDNGATYSVLATLGAAATGFTDSTAVGNQSYGYKVLASGASGQVSADSNLITVGTGVQTLAALELSSGEIDLSWSATASDISGYTIYRSTGGSSPVEVATLSPGATAYADTALAEGTHYFYQVQATETSNPMGFQTIDAWTLPSAPTSLVATPAGTGEVDLAWTNPSVSSPRVFILRCDDGSGSNYAEIDLTAAGATAYQDTTVQDGTFYTYEVASASGDVGGQSGNTPYAVATTPVAAPSALAATSNGQDEIDLSWTNNSQAATGYAVYRSTDSAMTGAVKIGTVPYADTPVYSDVRGPVHEVNAGTRYYYTVTAMAPYGESTPSAIAHAVTDVSVSAAGLNNVVNEGSVYTLNRAIVIESGVADPIGSWVINWGDGNTATIAGDPGTFTHVYNSAGPFTVTATTADGAYSGTQKVQVNYAPGTLLVNGTPDGPGNNGLIPNPTPHFAYSLNAAFTAPAGHHVNRWFINWGDGNAAQYPVSSPGLSGDSITFTHVYAYDSDYPMEYHPVIHAETDEDVYPWSPYGGYTLRGTVPYATWAGDPLWIGSTGPVGVDTAVGLSPIGPTYLGDSVTVDWGDPAPGAQGNTSTGVLSSDPSFTPDHPSHHYGTPGNYIVTTTDTSRSPSLLSRQVILVLDQGAIVTPIAEQVIGAGQPLSLAVSYGGLGAAVPVGVVDWGDGTGPHTFDLSGGGGFAASLAHAPPPNLGSSLGYGVGYSASIKVCNTDIPGNPADPATAYFTLDAWGVVIGDGANTGVLVASPTGTQNLLPVLVDFPHPVGEAVNLTLNTTDKTENDLWTTASPNVDPAIRSVDTPVAFDSNNNYAFSPASDAGYQVFWVGATAGDTTYDVLGYGIAAAVDTANCTAAFFTAEAGTPTVPPPQTLPATQPVLPVNKASLDKISIISNLTMTTDPITHEETANVLIGQVINLQAVWKAYSPYTGLFNNPSNGLSWSVPGNILHDIDEAPDASHRLIVPLKSDNGLANRLYPQGPFQMESGTSTNLISFFWVSTTSSSTANPPYDHEKITFTAHVPGVGPVTCSVYFNVYSPASTTEVSQGFPQIMHIPNLGGWRVGLFGPTYTHAGITYSSTGIIWNANVNQPSGFAAGTFRFVQKITDYRYVVDASGKIRISPFQGAMVLDDYDPYSSSSDDPFNVTTGWLTGSGWHSTNDTPSTPLNSGTDNTVKMYLSFQTYLMYCVQGGQWVPIQSEKWSFSISVVQRTTGIWSNIEPPSQSIPPFSIETLEPEWDAKLISPYYLVPG